MNLSNLQDRASDLFFAFNSKPDAATLAEIVSDMNRFENLIARYVAEGEMSQSIGSRLLQTASKKA